MFRCLSLGLAVLAVVAFSSVAHAADKGKGGAGGVFQSVADGKITVKRHKEEKTYDLAPTVKVTIKGAEGKIGDLKAGDHCRFTMADDKVSEIEVFEPKPKK